MQNKPLTIKQKNILKILSLSLIPLTIYVIYDLNERYQISFSYGAEYIKNGWIEENTSCDLLEVQIGLKTNNPFAPSDHIPALQQWQTKLDCNNENSPYWRNSDYNYNFIEGINLQGKQIKYVEFEEWVKNK